MSEVCKYCGKENEKYLTSLKKDDDDPEYFEGPICFHCSMKIVAGFDPTASPLLIYFDRTKWMFYEIIWRLSDHLMFWKRKNK